MLLLLLSGVWCTRIRARQAHDRGGQWQRDAGVQLAQAWAWSDQLPDTMCTLGGVEGSSWVSLLAQHVLPPHVVLWIFVARQGLCLCWAAGDRVCTVYFNLQKSPTQAAWLSRRFPDRCTVPVLLP